LSDSETPLSVPVTRRQLLTGGAVLAGSAIVTRLTPLSGQAAPQGDAAAPIPPSRPVAPPDAALVPGMPTTALTTRSPFETPAIAPTGVTSGSSLTPLQALHGTITPSDLHFQRHHNGVPLMIPTNGPSPFMD